MKKWLAPLALLFALTTGALAQWQTPNHSVPVGKGAGVTGFGSVGPCTSGYFVGGTGASTDPSCQGFVQGGTGATTRTWQDKARDTVSAKDFGAVGDNSADDTTALQRCINQAQTIHGACYIPAGRYKTTSALSVTSRVAIYGDGYQASGVHAYIPCCGVANLTAAEVANATTIIPSSTSNGINVATNDAAQIYNLQIAYTTQPTALSGITAITVTGATSGTCSFTKISDVMIAGADRGISVTDCVQWSIERVYFYNQVSYGILVNSTTAIPSSDWLIANNTFLSGSATTLYHIALSGQGGGRVVGNKLNSGGSINTTRGILVNPTVANSLSIEPLTIVGNSIEGVQTSIEFFGPSISTGSSSTQIVITGNQLWNSQSAGGGCIVTSAGPASSMWISGLVISGNHCTHQGGGGTNITIDGAQNVNIVGNTFGNVSGGSTAVSIGATTANVRTVSNVCQSGTTCPRNMFLNGLDLYGSTSGAVSINPQAAAGTFNFNLPTAAGTAGQPLLSGGGGAAAQTYGTLGVAAGGTGQTTLSADNILYGAGTGGIGTGRCSMDGNQSISCASTGSGTPQNVLTNSASDTNAAAMVFQKSRSGANTNANDAVGAFTFRPFANSSFQNGAQIVVSQSAASSGNNVPTKVAFTTSNAAGQLNQSIVFDDKGHLAVTNQSALPTVTAGCNGAGFNISGGVGQGRDMHATVTGQTAAATTCTVTFGGSFGNSPDCVASGLTSPLTGAITVTTTTLQVNFASTANYKWTFHCFGS
jgi:hypothetical protein